MAECDDVLSTSADIHIRLSTSPRRCSMRKWRPSPKIYHFWISV